MQHRTSSWRAKRQRSAIGATFILLTACASDADDSRLTVLNSSPIVIGSVVLERSAEIDDEYGLNRPQHLFVSERHVVVADRANQRVIVFDRNLRPVRTIGREGRGPGEFLRPEYVQEVGDTLVVADPRTARVSRFLIQGALLDEVGVRFASLPSSFVVRPGGVIVGATAGSQFYLARVRMHEPSAGVDELAARPSGLRLEDLPHRVLATNNLVAATLDRLVVVDNHRGAIVAYGTEGDHQATYFLPEQLHEALAERIRIAQQFPGMERATITPLFVESANFVGGALFLFLGLRAPYLGLLVDIDTGEARAIVSQRNPLTASEPAAAYLHDGQLFLLTRAGDIIVHALGM